MVEKGVDRLYEFYEAQLKKRNDCDNLPNGAQASEVSSNDSSSSKENLLEEQQRNITDEEKQRLATTPTECGSGTEKPFLETVYNALDCGENDYAALFGLSLLYAVTSNKGKFFIIFI